MDCILPATVHGIFQARILDWVGISYSRESFRPRAQTHASYISSTVRQIPCHCTTWEAIQTHIHTQSGILLSHKKNKVILLQQYGVDLEYIM